MLDQLIGRLNENGSIPEKYSVLFKEINITSKTQLVDEGDVIQHIYFVKKGCLRLWFNSNGNDITYQFYMENQAVSGFLDEEKSMFTLESIEPSTIVIIKKTDFEELLKIIPELKAEFMNYVFRRLAYYSRLFLSRIKDSPEKRYDLLLKNNPEIIARVPQHYIATYLGITPVSLSRIRNRKKKG
jgi:CRP-like cAMP-binding protein